MRGRELKVGVMDLRKRILGCRCLEYKGVG